MKMFIKFNRWYDNLREPKRAYFFFGVIAIPLTVIVNISPIAFVIILALILLVRVSYLYSENKL